MVQMYSLELGAVIERVRFGTSYHPCHSEPPYFSFVFNDSRAFKEWPFHWNTTYSELSLPVLSFKGINCIAMPLVDAWEVDAIAATENKRIVSKTKFEELMCVSFSLHSSKFNIKSIFFEFQREWLLTWITISWNWWVWWLCSPLRHLNQLLFHLEKSFHNQIFLRQITQKMIFTNKCKWSCTYFPTFWIFFARTLCDFTERVFFSPIATIQRYESNKSMLWSSISFHLLTDDFLCPTILIINFKKRIS